MQHEILNQINEQIKEEMKSHPGLIWDLAALKESIEKRITALELKMELQRRAYARMNAISVFAILTAVFVALSGFSFVIGKPGMAVAALGPALASFVGLIGFYRKSIYK